MCTSIAMKTNNFYFGRNMDIEYSFGERVVITPRNYPFVFHQTKTIKQHYAMIGMASVINNYPLYAEASNEKGLCMAGLYFPENACYAEKQCPNQYNIAMFELIPWVLGKCACINEARQLLERTNVTNVAFSKEISPAPLHWHIADKTGSIVLEIMKDGMHIYDNPANVLTNNPPFPFQLTNLSQYMNLTVEVPKSRMCQSVGVKPFGKGLGSFGLPGDFSPASRFVKAAYLLTNSVCGSDTNTSVSQYFHILDSVSVVNGSIELESGQPYYTTYSCCIDVNKGIYYFKTYQNNQISAICIYDENLDSDRLKAFPITATQQINWLNHF